MNTSTITTRPAADPNAATRIEPLTDACISDAFIISASYKAAKTSQLPYVAKAVICGQVMIERLSHLAAATSGRSKNRYTDPDDMMVNWLKKYCPEIPERTGRRWRKAAARAIAIITESHHSNPVVWLELSGQKFYVSEVLDMEASKASPEMLTFQETFRRFLADKTLLEVTGEALDGETESHNMDRASNGKNKGGYRRENRRDYAKFITQHFKELSNLIGRWDKFIEKDPSQHAKMTEALRNIILGGRIKLHEKGRPIDMPGWPASFIDLIEGLAKERRKGNSR